MDNLDVVHINVIANEIAKGVGNIVLSITFEHGHARTSIDFLIL